MNEKFTVTVVRTKTAVIVNGSFIRGFFIGVCMKLSAFLLATLILSFHSIEAKTLIVSDVDDTIKVTNVLNKKTIVYTGLISKKAFSGMSELYQSLNNSDTEIYYVSGSPKIIKVRVNEFLEENGFPQKNNLILKKGHVETYDYKVKAIRKLIKDLNPDKIILIGDDTEVDPEVYDTITKENPAKVESIYIRAIRNRELPSNAVMKNFFSAVEIAGFELLKGTLAVPDLSKVTKGFVDQTNCSEIVIKKRYCPKEGRAAIDELINLTDEAATSDLVAAQEKIIKTCN